ncbi:CsxC family protein [Anaerobacillus alkalidiazotrophicus]|nr:hypothetical protein [Anaerobacillus alkalidiazotrophicus]
MSMKGKVVSCKHQVKDVKTLSECSAEFRPVVGVDGPLVAKIPVVLAEPEVQINVEALIPLPERVLEIKRILKDLKITQCKLVPSGRFVDGLRIYKLFLEGCVRKNIEYATVDSHPRNKFRISGDIKHTTVNVPWHCVVEVPLDPDILVFREPRFFSDRIDFISKSGLSRDPHEVILRNRSDFQEKPFCEIVDAEVVELDIQEDGACWVQGEKTFRKLREKMVIHVAFKILQTQQVNIPRNNG